MKVTIRDELALSSVRTERLKKYLRRKGWTPERAEEAGQAFTRWLGSSEVEDAAEIVVPSGEHFRDYAQRVADALYTLEMTEGRSQLAILREIRFGRMRYLFPWGLLFLVLLPLLLWPLLLATGDEGATRTAFMIGVYVSVLLVVNVELIVWLAYGVPPGLSSSRRKRWKRVKRQ